MWMMAKFEEGMCVEIEVEEVDEVLARMKRENKEKVMHSGVRECVEVGL